MTWTTDKPTTPGWYWHRDLTLCPAPIIVLIQWNDLRTKLLIKCAGFAEEGELLEYTKGEWSGPIPEPEE